jgi:predicted permease
MRSLKRLFSRLRNCAANRRGDERLREEIQAHVAMQIEENVRAGMASIEARRQAILRLGAVEAIREQYYAEEGLPSFENVLSDLRYALRVLRKTPGFTIAAILIFALGISANLVVFLILYGVLLKPLPFPNPQQLVRIERSYSGNVTSAAYSGTKALFFERMNQAFSSISAYDYIPSHANLAQGESVVPISVLRVTSGFFHTFDMQPTMGRDFTVADMAPNAAGVVLLSNALWRLQFNSDPTILGKGITLGNRSYIVIGVANPRFALDAKSEAWIPLPITESPDDESNNYNVVGRMKPGVVKAAASSDLRRVLEEFRTAYPKLWDQSEGVQTIDLHDSFTGDLRPALRILMGAVGLLLLIVTANILSLLLTRAVSRRRELGVRVALGASAWRVLRQLLAENALLCVAGGVTGMLVAALGAPVLMRLSPIELPQFASLRMGGTTIVLAGALTLACSVVFSIVPMLETRNTRLHECLKLNSTRIAAGRHLAQRALVVSEVAISLVLLVGAILLLTTFWKIVHTPPGFATGDILTFKNSFTDQQAATSAVFGQHLTELKAQINALPGVESAGAAITLPTQICPDQAFDVIGRAPNRKDAGGDEKYIPATAGFLETLEISLIEGRTFTDADTYGSSPVMIVNQNFARTYFRDENPIGQHILIGKSMGPGLADPVREIIGVVGDVRQDGLDQPAPGIIYLPAAQIPDTETRLVNGLLGESWVVRTSTGGAGVLPAIRRIFMDNVRAPLLSVEPLSQVVGDSIAQQRFNMILLCGFGLISLFLGAASLYGVMSYTVARQTKEIGVRMALGAERSDIARMVLRDAGLLLAIGLALGIVTALAGARILSSLLFGVRPHDPLTLAAASALLFVTGVLSAWWPARRAARVEPMEALRTE